MRTTWMWMGLTGAVMAVAGVAACGGGTTCTSDNCATGGSSSTTTSGTTTSATTTTGTGGAGGQGGATTTTTTTATTTTTTTTGTGGGSGSVCGGKMGGQCPANEYCDYPDDICGAADGTGTCTSRPQVCSDLYAPTCACDGTVHGNPCDAAGAGYDVRIMGGCTSPAGMFPCGAGFCSQASQYCERTLSDVGGIPDGFSCKPLPQGCGNVAACACLSAVPCGGSCMAAPDNGLIVTCPGG